MSTTSIVNEREWHTELMSTCSFQFSPKTCQTMPLYAYLTPKIDFKRKFNHHQSFLYQWRLTVRTIRKFRIGPSLRIESRIGRRIRNRIESRSFAGPYLKLIFSSSPFLPRSVSSFTDWSAGTFNCPLCGRIWRFKCRQVRQIKPAQLAFGRTIK